MLSRCRHLVKARAVDAACARQSSRRRLVAMRNDRDARERQGSILGPQLSSQEQHQSQAAHSNSHQMSSHGGSELASERAHPGGRPLAVGVIGVLGLLRLTRLLGRLRFSSPPAQRNAHLHETGHSSSWSSSTAASQSQHSHPLGNPVPSRPTSLSCHWQTTTTQLRLPRRDAYQLHSTAVSVTRCTASALHQAAE